MSIESSGAAATPGITETGGATAARSQRGGTGAHGQSDAPSFLSLLMSLEPQGDAQAQLQGQAQEGGPLTEEGGRDPQALALALESMTMLAQNQGFRARPSQSEPTLESGQQVASLSATTLDPAGAAGAAGGEPGMPVAPETAAVAPLSTALVEAARAPAAASGGAERSGSVVDHVVGKRLSGDQGSRLSAEQASGVPTPMDNAQDLNNAADPGAAEAPPALAPMRANGRSGRSAPAADLSPFSASPVGEAEDRRTVVDGARADPRPAFSAVVANVSAAGGLMADAGGNPGKGSAGLRSGDRPGARSMLAPTGSATAGAWVDPQFNAGGVGPGIVFAPDSAVALPEAVVAERINYWISRGVQNAELRLDAFGGGAVAVSISVQGNEAMVEFRSDQAEARRLLAGAMPHLSELLERQGLVLSGGFVGTSAQDEPGARERKGSTAAARGAIVAVEIPASGAAPAQGRAAGRVVDLFV